MAEYHITRGPHGIYAGTRLKKTECTQEAILAVRDHLIVTFLDGTAKAGGYRWKTIDGRIIALYVHVTGGEHPAHDAAGKQADVAPVVHGWWKTVTGSNGKSYMVCTICRKQQALNGVFAYCPNCGAKMDGGRYDATD